MTTQWGRGGGLCASPFGAIGGGLTPRAGFVQLADALNTGDLAGTWWAMYGNGTMRAGSAVTLVPTGTPTNTTEAGWPVRTYTAAQNDQEPADVAFPQSDFSVGIYHRSVALPAADLMNFSVSGTNANSAAIPFEQAATGTLMSLISDGAVSVPAVSAAAGTKVAGVFQLMIFTYSRVGGVGNNVGDLYVGGVSVGTTATMRLAQAVVSRWSTNGYANAAGGTATATRGAFVTYKRLSAADVARITLAVGP